MQCRTQDHKAVSSSPASANVFVSLFKILSLNCFVDLSASRRYRSWEIQMLILFIIINKGKQERAVDPFLTR